MIDSPTPRISTGDVVPSSGGSGGGLLASVLSRQVTRGSAASLQERGYVDDLFHVCSFVNRTLFYSMSSLTTQPSSMVFKCILEKSHVLSFFLCI